jgi:hypothetical protein
MGVSMPSALRVGDNLRKEQMVHFDCDLLKAMGVLMPVYLPCSIHISQILCSCVAKRPDFL